MWLTISVSKSWFEACRKKKKKKTLKHTRAGPEYDVQITFRFDMEEMQIEMSPFK